MIFTIGTSVSVRILSLGVSVAKSELCLGGLAARPSSFIRGNNAGRPCEKDEMEDRRSVVVVGR
jgi:hypothetical protein